MISPLPHSDELPTSYPSTHDELISSLPVAPHPTVQTFVDPLESTSFGGSVPPEEMGRGSSGCLILPVDAVEGPMAETCGGADVSLSEMKDGDFSCDLWNVLPAGDVVGGGGMISGGVGGVPAEMGGLDGFGGANGRGFARGSDEVLLSEMKEMPVLGDVEEGFVEDDVGSRQENEISLVELKKKQLLSDLEHGCMFGEVDSAQALGNENVFEGPSVLDKLCDMDGPKQVVRKLCADNSGKMEGGVCRNYGVDLRSSLKIEVIDDTAVVEHVPICEVRSMVQMENEIPSGLENQKEEKTDGKKARRARRKAKSLHRNEEILRKQEDVNVHFEDSRAGQKLMYSMVEQALRYVNADDQQWCSGQYALFQNGQAGCKLMYKRGQLEALRYVNVEKQQRLWTQVYDGLGRVAKEYASLLSVRAQPGPGVDCMQQSLRRERGPGILSEVNPKQLNIELGNMGLNMNKVVGLSDPSRILDTVMLNEGDPDLEIVESCVDSEDDDECYASIQRPAFFVEGEPNFDAGPPEDGLEYLRRVRWEAAHIPDVKVAKLDNRRLNKVQSVYMPEIPEIPDCPAHLLPLKQWEDAFLADFSKLRLALSRIENDSQQISNNLQCLISSSDPDASKSGELKYEQACPDNVGNSPSPPVKESASSESSHETPPRLSVIHRMDSVARGSMLRKRIKKAAEATTSLSRNECLWLFALCAVVDTPLDADTCAALRSLLRKCASLRAEKAEMDDEVVMLNILVTVAGKYFGQSG
ncbi:hypothetical protein MLD38_010954 [Melastoma candidum]|uniref:Uncharacterized protein n=1 Tax=Melastoma candidum TaxID=119954 RepID=A0ACB9R1J3_9MYRT|nr:hypothetical protein MLD38_010954 [Melastoma candidum]